MKTVISVVLAVIMLTSMLAIGFVHAEDAAETTYTVTFVNYDGTVLSQDNTYKTGEIIIGPEYPTRESTDTMEYKFKGWQDSRDGKIDSNGTFLLVGEEDVTFTAVFVESEKPERVTIMSFIASLFQRLNMIFEYFSKIFGR